ncbi:MAG: hypothetical protein EBY17_30385 [Acidobacteriia bacterium]|nr:hypothetical protein [Terriglobia bacterium]
MKETDSQLPPLLYWLAVAMMAGLPLILVVALRAEILAIASESLAYRFFYSYRMLHGEGGNIWFLQGYLVSAAQNAFLFLSGAASAAEPDLRWAFQVFSWSTLALNLAVLATAAALVSFVRGPDWTDRVLLALVGVGPMYVTTGQGFQFSLWPDYYHLNVALCALGVAFFQVAWRRPEFARHVCWAFASGVFSGLATANKVTAGVCGAAFMLLLIFRPGLRAGGALPHQRPNPSTF